MDPLDGSVLVGSANHRSVGLIGYNVGGSFSAADEAEIRTLLVEPTGRGQGARGMSSWETFGQPPDQVGVAAPQNDGIAPPASVRDSAA
jgi:hypothetical protein